ncbi:aldehyde dehydrogenase (NADP(+)) [Costertonia aggregata]|uniref:Aldehyde dehydrogenase (NADP(+)) n=1 Tax=Costertonia aggregata TaxID=343403 RepID=A0A7H9ATM0_9FLAO|nr:aldehyde dehydrogenase (NADP(+)) [Costertonia aggregata]QLG46766.1 aldehyde dehydrogenase (NADP(+)) [Costertonia aggregata]
MITGKNYIGNNLSAVGSEIFKTFDPQQNQPNAWEFYEATHDEIDQAVQLAHEAFQQYCFFSGIEKAQFLRTIALEIEALGDVLLSTYCKESGLPQGRAIGERGRTIAQLNAFATLLEEGSWVDATIDTAQPDRQPSPKVDLRKMLFPLGPIAVFGSSNFPFAFSTAGGDTASALAAGCPVIVKSHPMHAGTSELVSSAITIAAQKTGMPNGVFSNLNSKGIMVGQKLVIHPLIKGVGFTGSIKGGTALYKLANERDEPIPVFAEMGSINPVIVFSSALKKEKEAWATSYANSMMLGAGQFCTNPGLILGIKSEDLDRFMEVLGKALEKLEPSCMLHPDIHTNFENGKRTLSEQADVSIVAEYRGDTNRNYAKQKVLKIDGANFLSNTRLHQEVFGPFSIVVECESIRELKQIIQKLDGQLTGTILGSENEISEHSQIVNALQNKVGRIIFNGVPTGVEVCPSMQHGGPFPASTDSRFTSVGTSAIKRWVRPVSYQNWPNNALPDELKDENPLRIMRLVNTIHTNASIL